MATDAAYDWGGDSARCYDLAFETLREQYLAERFPGETAEHWLARKQSRRNLRSVHYAKASPVISAVVVGEGGK